MSSEPSGPVITQFIESLNLVFKDMTTFKTLIIRSLFLLVVMICIMLGFFTYALFDLRREILNMMYELNKIQSAIHNLSLSLEVLTKSVI